jgi:hypothetical protein
MLSLASGLQGVAEHSENRIDQVLPGLAGVVESYGKRRGW